jgi:hypothetical protein
MKWLVLIGIFFIGLHVVRYNECDKRGGQYVYTVCINKDVIIW